MRVDDPHGSLDTLSREERSLRMSRVRRADTKPEMHVRRLVRGMGFRYRLGGCGLPGHPDLVFRSRRCVVFVHGCYWHRHAGCPLARIPKSPERREFWVQKLEANAARDARSSAALAGLGYRVFVVWECELRNPDGVARRLRDFLDEPA